MPRFDALYFHLFGLTRADAAYILDTCPIVRRHDKAAFKNYRTKAMIFAYISALAAGDTDSEVAVRPADSLSPQNPLQYCKTFRTLPQ